MIKTILAEDVTPEELEVVRKAISGLPINSELRVFIGYLLAGLDLGLNMTLISEDPHTKVIPDTV